MEKKRYFEEALSDFRFEVASGGEIRKMVSQGYSIPQIIENLTFPSQRSLVEKAVLKYCLELKLVYEELPGIPDEWETVSVDRKNKKTVCRKLAQMLDQNEEKNSLVLCPYGTWRRDREMRLQKAFACLTKRERDYIEEFPWPMQKMYHVLNSRMYEIHIQMIMETEEHLEFYFIRSGQKLVIL